MSLHSPLPRRGQKVAHVACGPGDNVRLHNGALDFRTDFFFVDEEVRELECGHRRRDCTLRALAPPNTSASAFSLAFAGESQVSRVLPQHCRRVWRFHGSACLWRQNEPQQEACAHGVVTPCPLAPRFPFLNSTGPHLSPPPPFRRSLRTRQMTHEVPSAEH